MFPPFPDFENIVIPLEIEWRGQTRPVEVRIEQLPTEPVQAVPVCSFPDAPHCGQWLLASHGYDIYTLGNPYSLLQVRPAFHGSGQEEDERIQLNPRRVKKLRETVERAVNSEQEGVRVVRVAEITELPHPPRIALVSEAGGFWLDAWKSPTIARFATLGFDLYEQGAQLHQWTKTHWEYPDSDVRFAWQWATWTDEERTWRSYGGDNPFKGREEELQKVILWVLISCTSLWEHYAWSWYLTPNDDHGELHNIIYWRDRDRIYREYRHELVEWQQWLWNHFCPGWRADWMSAHPCVKDFWKYKITCSIEIPEPPTMHEQLEARLQLREWLQEKAPPDQAIELMSQLL